MLMVKKIYGRKNLKGENLSICIHTHLWTGWYICKSEKESSVIAVGRSMAGQRFPGICALRIPTLFFWSTVQFASRQTWRLTPGLQRGDENKGELGHTVSFPQWLPVALWKSEETCHILTITPFIVFLNYEPQSMRPTSHFAAPIWFSRSPKLLKSSCGVLR